MRKIVIPPGGFLGWGQQTAATQALLAGRAPTRRKRKKVTRKKRPVRRRRAAPASRRRRAPATRRKTRRAKKPAYMVKGSAAAKRHMAKLRRMRKR